MADHSNKIRSLLFKKLISIFLLLLHLGCFVCTSSKEQDQNKSSKKFKSSSLSRIKPARRAITYSWSYLKRIFSNSSNSKNQTHPTNPTLTSARSSQQSLVCMIQPEAILSDSNPVVSRRKKSSGSVFCLESDITSDPQFFPLRNDIFPCTTCGEIFQKPSLLEQHQAVKHAVSELINGDSGRNIVRIIFSSDWSGTEKIPEISRILKIHNSPKILTRFEEYREFVKSKAAVTGAVNRRDERCIADGNELLRFYCSTFTCDLGLNGDTGVCNQQYCNICGIIKSGFSAKMDGISTLSSSCRAHLAIPAEVEEEFQFMNVKRAMLVCRVVAGRVGCESVNDEFDNDEGGFDSVVGRTMSGPQTNIDEEELLVFNPRAVLPCFVIVYTV